MKLKTPRIYICIDQSMIWEAYSDEPLTLIIKNIDKEWIRYLPVQVSPAEVDEHELLLMHMTENKITQMGLKEEEAKHLIKEHHPMKIKKKAK